MEQKARTVEIELLVEQQVADAVRRVAQEAQLTPEEAAGELLAENLRQFTPKPNTISGFK